MKYGLGVTDYVLMPDYTGQIEFILVRLDTNARSGDKPYSHHSEVVGLVISGELELWIDREQFMLEEGDSFRCKTSIPHWYRNSSGGETIMVMAYTPLT